MVLGFHGCDKSIRDKIVSTKGEVINPSENEYDWLGHGAYFWENNHERALLFAQELKENPPKDKKNPIKEPAVLGAVIDLGYCLDLLDSDYLKILKESYDFLCASKKQYGKKIP